MGRTGTAAAVLALAATGVLAAPAQAAPPEKGSFSDSWHDVFEDCGTTIEVHGEISVRYALQQRGKDPALFYSDHVTESETYTNLATGRSWSVAWMTMGKDLRLEPLGDDLYAGTGFVVGRLFTVYDENGNVYYQDRGRVEVEYVWNEATRQFVEFPEDTRLSGLFQSEDHDFCGDLEALTT